MQKRQCNNPSPASGGKYCEGPDVQFIGCNEEKCTGIIHAWCYFRYRLFIANAMYRSYNYYLPYIADGGWSDWRSVEECSSTCRGGYRLQYRECNNPPPSGDGASCTGSSQQYAPCNNHILCHGGKLVSYGMNGSVMDSFIHSCRNHYQCHYSRRNGTWQSTNSVLHCSHTRR